MSGTGPTTALLWNSEASVGRRRSLTPRQKSSSIALEPFEKRSSIVLCHSVPREVASSSFVRRSLIERIHVEKDFGGGADFVIASW